jgi:hypothetical protein
VDGGEAFDLCTEFRSGVFEDIFRLTGDACEQIERSFTDQFSLGEDADAVADILYLLEEMGGEQHGLAPFFQSQDEITDLTRSGRVDPRCRFVEDQEARIVDHGLSQADALEHPLGIGADAAITCFPEAREIEKFRDSVLKGLTPQSAEAAMEGDRLRSCQELVEVGVLRKKSDIGATADLMARDAEDFRGSRGGVDSPSRILSVVLLPEPLGPSSP